MPVGPAQCVEIHQTLILRQLPLRARTRLAKLGRQKGQGRWVAVAQTYTVKATYAQVDPLDKEQKRVDREDK